jgi:hypothetical protein
MWGALSDERTGLSFTMYILTTPKLVSVITHRNGPRRKTPFIVVLLRFRGNVFVFEGDSVTVAYTCLLKIGCLAANVVSKSLPSNGSTRYNIVAIFVRSISDQHTAPQ